MVNNELNKKIVESVRNRVVISNLESEENMKINKRKQIVSLVAVMLIMLTGSFITVNAAANGELAEKAKDTIQVIFTDKDGKIVLTIAFLISLLPMLLNQDGGKKGVQEISGLINLFNLIGIISVVLFIIGVWVSFKNKKTNKILGALGTIGIVVSEIYQFFTWHIMNITGKMSIHNSIEFAFPEFYIGLAISLIMIFIYFFIDKIVKE